MFVLTVLALCAYCSCVSRSYSLHFSFMIFALVFALLAFTTLAPATLAHGHDFLIIDFRPALHTSHSGSSRSYS